MVAKPSAVFSEGSVAIPALLMSTSTRSRRFSTSSTKARTDAKLARSSGR